MLCELNRFAFGNGYSFDPHTRTIFATAGYTLHEQTASWRIRQFLGYTIGQLIFTETEADYLADVLGGQVAVSAHPASGYREQPDDMLNVVEDVIAPAGKGPSPFTEPFEFTAIEDMARTHPDMATIGASANGIALECTYGSYTAITILAGNWRHRRLGSGLRTRLQIPDSIDHATGARMAAMLNRLERSGESGRHHLGAWTVDRTEAGGIAVTYAAVIPIFQFVRGLCLDAAIDSTMRARWADRLLNGQRGEPSAWKQLAARFGMASKER